MTTQLFINLPVADVAASRAFFTQLGYKFSERFSDATSACLIFSDVNYAMLISRTRWAEFSQKPITDTQASSEMIVSITAPDREGVDTLAQKAIALGATEAYDPKDHGFMYVRSFFDLDGHQWEIFFMDMDAMNAAYPMDASATPADHAPDTATAHITTSQTAA